MTSFVLAHLSDPHLSPLPAPHWLDLLGKRATGYFNWQRRRRFIHDSATLEKIVGDLRAAQPDHIAVTGDIANIALPEEFRRGRAWLRSLGSPADVSFVPGNHDMYVPEALKMLPTQWGDYMMSDAGRGGLPFVRRRGPIALIGLSSGVPTAPFLATGWLGSIQLSALKLHLAKFREEGLFRVVLIYHPPITNAGQTKRLLDASVLLRVLAEAGAELVLHGHDHIHAIVQLKGPNGPIPAVGVPSASALPSEGVTPAAYNLYRISGGPGAWQCEATARGLGPDGQIVELGTTDLLAS